MIKVILVDDHRLVRAGLARMVRDEADMEVVAEAETGEDAQKLVREHEPDVVLMDINMPGVGGLEATRRILQHYPKMKIIVISMHMEEPYPSRLLEAGAVGYISKDAAVDEVVTAIRQVMTGRHYVGAEIAGGLAAKLVKGNDKANPFDTLSQREMQVMLMVTKGQGNQQISDVLCLSPKTISTYRYRLYEKLDVHNDVELTRMAMRYGILDDDPQAL